MQKPKVIVIIGPTATGKSDLAVELAKKYHGEVISADARQVYQGLDIGTGKITKDEMKGVFHHLLDVVNPKKVFTASDFVKKGRASIAEIAARGKIPIIVGGTGFYISALLGEISLPAVPPNKKLREKLEKLSNVQLTVHLATLDPTVAASIDINNRHRLIRYIEVIDALGKLPNRKSAALYDSLKIGIDFPDKLLRERINKRLCARLRKGMLSEARHLHDKGLSWKRMEQLGLEYRYMSRHLKGDISKKKMIELLETKIWQYVKRQRTWFKRDKQIHWFKPSEIVKIEKEVKNFFR